MSLDSEEISHLNSLLYRALAEPLGLLLRTSDWQRARARLYQARARLGDPALAGLQIRRWPGAEGDLAIVRGAEPRSANATTNLVEELGI